jgi:hypothetical protein
VRRRRSASSVEQRQEINPKMKVRELQMHLHCPTPTYLLQNVFLQKKQGSILKFLNHWFFNAFNSPFNTQTMHIKSF